MGSIATEPLLRLMQLVSPALPVGGFAYSQGLEWALEVGWIRTTGDLEAWLADQLVNAICRLDLPLLIRMQAAVKEDNTEALARWIDWLLAARETSELRAEESDRGRALADLLAALELPRSGAWRPLLARSQTAGFAFAAATWGIPPQAAALGYTWTWLENLVLAAVKLAPLGQTQGQRILTDLIGELPALVEKALGLGDEDIGAAGPALAIASSAHEGQYTRLFRS